MLNSGTPLGAMVSTLSGGQVWPTKAVGEREKCKNPQNKENKSIISLKTKRENLNFKLSKICREYSPLSLSQTMSILQRATLLLKQKQQRLKRANDPVFRIITRDVIPPRTQSPTCAGQGEK